MYEEHLDERFGELTSKNSPFDRNLLDKNRLRILFSHNFYSLPSDYYESSNEEEFDDRENDVNRLLNLYYNKIKDFVEFDNVNNFYTLAKLKDGIRDRNLKKIIKTDARNFNTLSIYGKNLEVARENKSNLYNN